MLNFSRPQLHQLFDSKGGGVMKRRKFLKVAVTLDEYSQLSILADQEGLTLSAYVRKQLADKRQAIETDAALARIEAKLMPASESATQLEPLLVESLLLVRELVAERNPQVISRISQRLNSTYPSRSIL
jgi:hypothetical protein